MKTSGGLITVDETDYGVFDSCGRCGMQLTFLLALVLAFSSLLRAEGYPVASSDVQLSVSALACAAFLALAWWTGQLRRHVDRRTVSRSARLLRHGERWHGAAYLAVVGIAFGWFDFAEIVHSNWQLQAFVWADDVVVVVALIAPLGASWLLDPLVVERQQSGVTPACPLGHTLREVVTRARHTVLLPLIPILLITGIADFDRLFGAANDRSLATPVAVLTLIVIACGLPWLLRYCWPTRPLETGPARTLIETTLAEAGVNVRQILRWETHVPTVNAAVTGFLPSLRYLFVSNELLRRMGRDDLRAITAHEAAHCRHGHLPRLGISLVIPLVALSLTEPLVMSVFGASQAGTSLLIVTVLGLWAIWHGRWARLLEHHADLAACRQLSGDEVIGFAAVETLGGALQAAGAHPGGDWLHPSPRARVALLRELVDHPAAQAVFDRRIRVAFRIQALITAGLILTWLWCL